MTGNNYVNAKDNMFRPYTLWENAKEEYSGKIFGSTVNNGDNHKDSGLRFNFNVSRKLPTAPENIPISYGLSILLKIA